MANYGFPGMSYAKNLLEKYGWTEGKGLGKTESGMVEALKPKLKFDNTGIGHDHAEQFTFNWWEMAFNEAAKRVNPLKGNLEEQKANDLCISTKRPSITKLMKENRLKYGKFIKTETLTNGGELIPVRRKSTTPDEVNSPIVLSSNLSDDELFKICGGRTAHKAARHGHKLVGKLARVIEQEKEHLSTSENSNTNGTHLAPSPEINFETDVEEHVIKKKKKRKKELIVEEYEKHSDVLYAQCTNGNGGRRCTTDNGDNCVDSHDCKETKKKKKRVHNAESASTKTFKASKGKKRHNECTSEYNFMYDNLGPIRKVNDSNTYEEHGKRRKKKKSSR